MRLIDRIALNRAAKLILDFILELLKVFSKSKPGQKPNSPVTPDKRRRPLKDLVDNVLPWRNK